MSLLFPRAFAFAIDDLGWNEGSNLSGNLVGGPHRAGVKRKFDLSDYQCIVEVGKAVNARVQCLFVLSEMDRKNILAKYPTTTYQRQGWNNSDRLSEEQKMIMDYVRDNSAYMEFGLHGTGHEYWAPGETQKRAEWYNMIDRKPWPEESLREHIQCFKEIMAQYGFSKQNGHSFPESFVPCAYSYYWNPNGEYSLGKLLTEVGVKFANTDFSQIPELNPPKEVNGGDFDFGTHVINRINYGNLWHELAKLPTVPLMYQLTDVIESHWPNWLAQDDFLQPTVTQQWIDYYKAVQHSEDRYIAKNTEQLHAQWLYKKFATITEFIHGTVEIDNTAMPLKAYNNALLGNMVLKVKLNAGEHVSNAKLNNKPIAAYMEEAGYGFLYLPPLERKKYSLSYEVGSERPNYCVENCGTFNVYETNFADDKLSLRIRIYGDQTVRIHGPIAKRVQSNTPDLVIREFSYDSSRSVLSIHIRATDMQGSTGSITVDF